MNIVAAFQILKILSAHSRDLKIMVQSMVPKALASVMEGPSEEMTENAYTLCSAVSSSINVDVIVGLLAHPRRIIKRMGIRLLTDVVTDRHSADAILRKTLISSTYSTKEDMFEADADEYTLCSDLIARYHRQQQQKQRSQQIAGLTLWQTSVFPGIVRALNCPPVIMQYEASHSLLEVLVALILHRKVVYDEVDDNMDTDGSNFQSGVSFISLHICRYA